MPWLEDLDSSGLSGKWKTFAHDAKEGGKERRTRPGRSSQHQRDNGLRCYGQTPESHPAREDRRDVVGQQPKADAVADQIQIPQYVARPLCDRRTKSRLLAEPAHGIMQLRRTLARDHDERVAIQVFDSYSPLRRQRVFRWQADHELLFEQGLDLNSGKGNRPAQKSYIQGAIGESGLLFVRGKVVEHQSQTRHTLLKKRQQLGKNLHLGRRRNRN